MIPIHHQSSSHGQTDNQGPGQQPHFEGTPHPRQQVPHPDYPDSVPAVPKTQYQAAPTVSRQSDESNEKSSTDPSIGQSVGESPDEKPKPKTPMDTIYDILTEVRDWEAKVSSFNGVKTDGEYKYLEEMLTRNLIKLDGIESGSNTDIRQARKTAVCAIQASLDQLELKAFSAEQDVDSSQPSASGQTGDGVNQNNGSRPPQNVPHVPVTSGSRSDPTKVKEMVLDSEINC